MISWRLQRGEEILCQLRHIAIRFSLARAQGDGPRCQTAPQVSKHLTWLAQPASHLAQRGSKPIEMCLWVCVDMYVFLWLFWIVALILIAAIVAYSLRIIGVVLDSL